MRQVLLAMTVFQEQYSAPNSTPTYGEQEAARHVVEVVLVRAMQCRDCEQRIGCHGRLCSRSIRTWRASRTPPLPNSHSSCSPLHIMCTRTSGHPVESQQRSAHTLGRYCSRNKKMQFPDPLRAHQQQNSLLAA